MIVFDGEETIRIHDDEASARAALIRFVDERWASASGNLPLPLDDDDRVRQFFTGEHDSYLIAEADLSDVAEALERLPADYRSRPPR